MKQTMIRTASVVLLLATLLSILPIFGSTQSTLVYSTTSNSGLRDQLCTTLDGTGADAYYGNDYDYDLLSQLSATALYNELAELMTDTHKKITTYTECRDLAVKTDCEQNDGRIIMLYTSYSATRSDYNTGTSGWNREHVWPKSLGGFETSNAGADLHHIRPANAAVNTSRNNNKYGEVEGGSTTSCTMGGQTLIGGYRQGGDYFEPLDNVKGDVARICLYLYVRWAAEYPQCKSVTNVFQSVDVLLDWCEQDPVDTWEMGRNEVVGAIQGNRNVFIDYPEYAWLLFGREVPEDMITPSGEASDGNAGSDTCAHPSTEIKNATSATCGKDGYTGDTYCKECGKRIKSGSTIVATGKHTFGAWKTNADGSKSRTCSVCGKVETEGVVTPGTTTTIHFTDAANRTVYTTSQQVWKQNGITVVNDKASATSNVGDYVNPGRFYKGSKVTITAPGMTKIVIDCSGIDNKYVNSWSNSFTDSNATATVSSTTVTITFKTPVDSFTWDAMSAQGRAYKMTVSTSSEGGTTPPATTPVPPPETTPDTPVVPSTLADQIAAAGALANTEYLPYESTITGTITDTPKPSDYNEGQFKFTVSDGTNTLLCYYTPVTGGTPAKGDTVTVTGKLTAYNGAAQFDSTASAVLKKDGGDAPCTHTKTELRGVKAATCKDTGYTGDTYCTACGEKIATGKTIAATGSHTFGQWSTNDDGSKSRTCSVCGKMETEAAPPATDPVTPPVTEPVTPPATEPDAPVTPPADCPHTNVEYKNAVDPTCKEGYSGDLYCKDCGVLVEEGMVYPPVSAHEYGEATLSDDGKLETRICKVCGDKLETAIADSNSDLTILWIVIGCSVVALVVVAVILIKKRKG